MTLSSHVAELRSRFVGFNPPATKDEIGHLMHSMGTLPSEIFALYADHNGTNGLAKRGGACPHIRLMPTREAVELNATLATVLEATPSPGRVGFFWCDDNSNYAGIYLSGLLTGWVTLLLHDEQLLVPAFRSIERFYRQILASCATLVELTDIERELPAVDGDELTATEDEKLAIVFRELYDRESDPDQRRIYAACSMALTPVNVTISVLPYLLDRDLWTPELAVELLELRRYTGGVDELEHLAENGTANGDSAAMRCLVRMNTTDSQSALARIRQIVTGDKLDQLDTWIRLSTRLQPPCWP